ncbi:hypothetical protein [Paenibacillus wulumuqiensis]|uniref:hypothetical protein n=1 Tax=Paenibacillus wulumuqiensis TaxID=1567107 RepID=UPI00061999AD|nr:hypothetical protein [Paenibacillus wulumuqiensis]
MDSSNDLPHSNLQSPNSLFHIDRQHVPALLSAMQTGQQDEIAEQFAGKDYALPLLLAVEAAQQRANELAELARNWSPPLSIDLALCSIDCTEEYSPTAGHLLIFWFYSEEGPENWIDGYSDQFYDITVEINADLLTVHRTAGPSR